MAEPNVEDDLRDYGVAYQWVEEGKPARRMPPENVVRIAMNTPLASEWLPAGEWPTEPGRYWFYGQRYEGAAAEMLFVEISPYRGQAKLYAMATDGDRQMVIQKAKAGPFRFAPVQAPSPPSLEEQ